MYGGGGFSTLIEDAWASSLDRPGDDGTDEFGGDGNGDKGRFCGIEACDDDAPVCRWEVDWTLDRLDSSDVSTDPSVPARTTNGGGGCSEGGTYEGGGEGKGMEYGSGRVRKGSLT